MRFHNSKFSKSVKHKVIREFIGDYTYFIGLPQLVPQLVLHGLNLEDGLPEVVLPVYQAYLHEVP